MTHRDIHRICTDLQMYARLDNTSYGEKCMLLAGTANACYPIVSDEFALSLQTEIKSHADYYKRYCKIVSVEHQYTESIQALEWAQ